MTKKPDAAGSDVEKEKAAPASKPAKKRKKKRSATAAQIEAAEKLRAKSEDTDAPISSDEAKANEKIQADARALLEAERQAVADQAIRNPVLPLWRANSLGCAEIVLDRFFTENGMRVLVRWNEVWYVRKDGKWGVRIDDDIEQMIQQKLSLCRMDDGDGSAEEFHPSCAAQAEIQNQIAKLVNISSTLKPPMELTESGWVEVDTIGKMISAGHVVDMESGKTRSKTRMFHLDGTEWEYDPDAKCPLWDGFLDDVFPVADEDRTMLGQWFGYVSSGSTRLQKAMMIEGPPRAGKGIIGHVLSELVGRASIVSPSLQQLSDNFGLQPLLDKKLLLSSDVRLSGKTDIMGVVEKILRITGGDEVSVGRKYTGAIQAELGVRVMMLTNSAPHISDNNEAFFSRFLIIRLEKSFFGKEDPNLLEKLRPELPGIANWQMRHYQSLIEHGRFAESESSTEARKDWHLSSDPIARFANDCCDVGNADAESESEDLYAAYVQWAKYLEKLRHWDTKDWMMRNLYATLGDQIKRKKVKKGAKKVVAGISLKADKVAELIKLEKEANAF